MNSSILNAAVRSAPRGALLTAVFALLTAVLMRAPVVADDVYLTNGGVFEEVVSRTTDTHVIIEMAIGKLTLPLEQVSKVVAADTPIAEFRRRREALLEDPTSSAERWLHLARWGLAHGLQVQSGQAALLAARLQPDLDGLAPILQGLGYHQVATIGWLPKDEAMRLQGRALYDGEWLTSGERNRRIAADRESSARRGGRSEVEQSATRDRGSDAVALASIKLAEKALEQGNASARRAEERADRAEQARRARTAHGFAAGYAVYGVGAVAGQRFASPEAAAAYSEQLRQDLRALAKRSPGSIIPVQPTTGSTPQRTGIFGPQYD